MTWIKKGEQFLQSISKNELNELYKKEKNAKANIAKPIERDKV